MTEERIERTRAEQLAEVEHILAEQQLKHEQVTNTIKAVWEQRAKQLWESVDRATAIVKARLEEEQRVLENQKRKQEEERQKEEEAERIRIEKEETERERVEEEKRKKEAEEKKEREKEQQEKREPEARLAAEKAELDKYEKERQEAGFTTVDEDWETMLDVVKVLLSITSRTGFYTFSERQARCYEESEGRHPLSQRTRQLSPIYNRPCWSDNKQRGRGYSYCKRSRPRPSVQG
jgi:outer membrane biosynthesis protein TonB